METEHRSSEPKAFIFLMDYANSQRVKLWGTGRVVEDDAELLDQLGDPDYPGKVERAIVFTVEAWDINWPQLIHKRFPQREITPLIEELQGRIAYLESQLAPGSQRTRRLGAGPAISGPLPLKGSPVFELLT